MSDCKNHDMMGSIDCIDLSCQHSYIAEDLKEAWRERDELKAKVEDLENRLLESTRDYE